MNYVGKIFSGVRGFYNEINPATLSGAIDIVVVEQADGSLVCSPFHVRFGKMGVLRSREKVVDISVNGVPVPGLHMKLGEAGEAFFVQELDESVDIPIHLATSPLPSSEELMAQGVLELRDKCVVERKISVVERQTLPAIVSLPRRHSDNELDVKATSTNTAVNGGVVADSEFKPITQDYPISPKPSRLEVLTSGGGHADDDSDSSPSTDHNKRRAMHRTMKKRRMRVRARELAKTESAGSESQEGVFDMDMPTGQDDDVTPTVAMGVSLPEAVENRMDRTDEWASQTQFNSAFHPFSDGDLTPIASPDSSRPHSPKSDTEFEYQRQTISRGHVDTDDIDVRWPWGELPDAGVIAKASEENKAAKAEEKKDLMKFLKSNQKHHLHRLPKGSVLSGEGMYLDQLNSDVDPELAALYLYQARSSSHQLRPKDEDCESGRGASLPQSPLSHEGAKSSDESEEKAGSHDESGGRWGDISISLCGRLLDDQGKISPELFMQSLISYDDFVQNPELINNPDLVIKIGSKFYNWQVAGPFILSLCVYQRPLPGVALESLMKTYMPKKKPITQQQQQQQQRGGMSSWFSWRRAAPATTTTTTDNVVMETQVSIETEKKEPLEGTMSSPGSSPPLNARSSMKKEEETSSEAETESSDKDGQQKYSDDGAATREKYKKVVRLTSEQLESLNLHEGRNEVTFSVTTALQGTTRCTSHIYKWRHNDRIVVSDIDGTITKSDVLGQILPMVGKDWSQTGVAQLYSKIAKNGYKFLYLSARAIGQSTITRDYLRSIRQGELMLPDGPLLLSPSSLISAFHREVIERKPEEFKISCLRDIGALFPEESNPFYAGFGNKINDVWAYRATGIPIHRIFTINHRGELKHELTHTFQSSYTSLSDVSDHFFPSLGSPSSTGGKLYAPDKFSTFTYWRDSLPEINDEIEIFFGK